VVTGTGSEHGEQGITSHNIDYEISLNTKLPIIADRTVCW